MGVGMSRASRILAEPVDDGLAAELDAAEAPLGGAGSNRYGRGTDGPRDASIMNHASPHDRHSTR